jgi:o-succinylbenzoate synthase
MNLDAIDLFHVALPLVKPLAVAGRTLEKLETVLVRVQSGDTFGWGEASPGNAPLMGPEWAAGAFLCLRDWLAPAVKGRWVESGDALQKQLEFVRGNRYAKAALDIAWWDLKARREGKPLYQLLEGSRDAVEVGPTFDQMETIDELLAELQKTESAGFARVGLKFRPGWDVQVLNFVRHEFPVLPIHIDCEGQLRLDHMEMLCRLDDFSLSMIEQPLAADDYVGHAMVQEAVRTPLCLADGIATLAQAEMALELHSCKFVKIELGRVGGITPALAIYKACHDGGTPCWVGMPLQSSVGHWSALALAAKSNCTYPADFVPNRTLLAVDLAEAPTPAADPTDNVQRVRFADRPGIGVDPDLAVLEKHLLARASV